MAEVSDLKKQFLKDETQWQAYCLSEFRPIRGVRDVPSPLHYPCVLVSTAIDPVYFKIQYVYPEDFLTEFEVAFAGKQYASRDVEAIFPFYFRHLDAMTTESLYHKSDIAAELSWRDSIICELSLALLAKQRSYSVTVKANEDAPKSA